MSKNYQGVKNMNVLNIEKLKKVNSLADTLRKHGLAANMLDAANLAEKFGGDEEFSNLRHLKINKKQELEVVDVDDSGEKRCSNAVNNASANANTSTSPQPPGLNVGQVERILQKFCDSFGEEIKKLNSKIIDLTREVTVLKNKEPENNQYAKASQQETAVAAKRFEVSGEKVNNVPNKHTSDTHPRSGSYNSEDVSVEKFFYFGSK